MKTVARLIESFVPEHYDLKLTLEREARHFSGTVTIDGASTENATGIDLHAKDLTISSVMVDDAAATFTADDQNELHIEVADVAGKSHRIVIEFSGTITDGMHGLYPCYYEHDGIKKELLATQFESHHAREVFPCADEPEAKATFDVTLVTEPNVTVLGNMPIKTQQTKKMLTTTFERTPRMSSYLLAFVVGELHSKSAKTTRGIDVNVYATPAQPAESLDFALDVATKAIDFYEDYFGVDYPLPKSDHVALPDFSSGAMENWGLITYRENALLARPNVTSITAQHGIATVITHELAHQWFGNLVTMRWWNDLWLNESFANIMEYISVDRLFPEWNIWLDYAASEPLYAMRRDSIDGVQSVQVDVTHPDEIMTLFDSAIVYAKGGRLMRMLEHYIGEAVFREGLKAYFTAFAYKNAEGNDLWRALSKASGKDVTTLMNIWISQPGFPVVHASVDGSTLTLHQEQFFTGEHKPSKRLWPIPLGASNPALPELMEDQTITIELTGSEPLLLNHDSTTHYLPHYDDELFGRLVAGVSELAPIDRLALLSETVLLIRGGLLPSTQIIPLLSAYAAETLESVWDLMAVSLAELRRFIETDKVAERKLRSLSATIARSEYERLGWAAKPHEDENDTKLRAIIIGMMLYGDDQDALDQAQKLYDSAPLEKLEPELRSLILSSVVRYAKAPMADALLERYAHESSADIRHDMTLGLTSTRSEDEIQIILNALKDPAIVRPQDVVIWFVSLMRNRYSRDLAWRWVRDNWEWLAETFGGDKSYDDFVRCSAVGLMYRRQLGEFREFFAPLSDEPILSRAIAMGASEIKAKVELIERDGPAVIDALKQL